MAASEEDERWMRRCLELAARGAGFVSPNPLVGCVIVSPRGRVVAEGYHKRLGGPHAEAEALAAAGRIPPGSTLYVNLEPCAHRKNRRTEPCAPKVFDAGVARVVIGGGDPIRSHAGGARWLARQGVEVTRGVLRAECAELNRFFITWAKEKRPHVVLKAAATLDGRVATHTGDSQWITGTEARRDGHRMRGCMDAILVGVGTVLADDPRLTARGVAGADPLRIVVDSRLRTPPSAALLPANSPSRARVIIATTESAPAIRETRLSAQGAEVWRLAAAGRRVSLAALMSRLGAEEISSVLVEGGPRVHRGMLDEGLAHEVTLYLAPRLLAGAVGSTGAGWLGGPGIAALQKACALDFVGQPVRLGTDLRLTLRPRKAKKTERNR